MQGIELNQLPLASPTSRQKGWTIDTDFLDEIKKAIDEFYPNDRLGWEEIETVLLVLRLLDSKRRLEHK